jgi:gamma-glutamylcyclotransferase (GGCT)/AIG2-like uncharacterized protein YtfP
MLNFLEQLLYLEERGELTKEDREIFFDYWISLLNRESNTSLRRYVCRKGFELLASNVSTNHKDHEHVAFYGTLRSGSSRQQQLAIDTYLKLFGRSDIRGNTHELPTCPGLVVDEESDKSFEVEIFCLEKEHELFAIEVIDQLEGFNPNDPRASRFIRHGFFDKYLNIDFWMYEISQEGILDALGEIPDKNWEDFVLRTSKDLPDSPPGYESFPPHIRREIESRKRISGTSTSSPHASRD